MKQSPLTLPDKLFGLDSALMMSFLPLVGLILGVIFSFSLVIIPKYDEFNSTVGEIKLMDNRNKTVVEKTRYLQSIDPEELKTNSELINNALLPQKNAYVLVGVVKSIAQKYSYQIDSFSISPGKMVKEGTETATTKGVAKIPIKVSILGPKAGYIEFIKGIERTLPVLSINSFKMEAQGSLIKLDLEIAASYLEDNSKFDISRLSLTDLTLKKEEMDILATINQYTTIDNLTVESGAPAEYKKYARENPFLSN